MLRVERGRRFIIFVYSKVLKKIFRRRGYSEGILWDKRLEVGGCG